MTKIIQIIRQKFSDIAARQQKHLTDLKLEHEKKCEEAAQSTISEIQEVDYLKRFQLINGALDIPLKVGAMSIILGAIIIRQYLSDIGFKNLFSTVIGSQSGLLAIIFGFGIVFFLIWILLIFSPWLLWQVQKSLKAKYAENFLSFLNIFIFSLLIQSTFILLTLSSISTSWFYLSILIPLFAMCKKEAAALGLFDKFLFAGCIWGCLVTSMFPFLVVAHIIELSITKGVLNFNQDLLQYVAVSTWTIIYAFVSAALFSGAKATHQKNETSVFIGCGVVYFGLLFALFNWSPKYFINSAMSATSMRQTQVDATWWAIDKTVYEQVVPSGFSGTVIGLNKSIYMCAYSPLLLAERVILCPSKEKIPNASSCHSFLGTEVRSLTKSVISSSTCLPSK
jgi:hypothetical protein